MYIYICIYIYILLLLIFIIIIITIIIIVITIIIIIIITIIITTINQPPNSHHSPAVRQRLDLSQSGTRVGDSGRKGGKSGVSFASPKKKHEKNDGKNQWTLAGLSIWSTSSQTLCLCMGKHPQLTSKYFKLVNYYSARALI